MQTSQKFVQPFKFLHGNRNCPCCFPGPGSKGAEYRKAKRRSHREAMKIAKSDLLDMQIEQEELDRQAEEEGAWYLDSFYYYEMIEEDHMDQEEMYQDFDSLYDLPYDPYDPWCNDYFDYDPIRE